LARRNVEAPVVAPYTPPWVEVAEWDGLAKGDPVAVKGTTLSTFTFQSVHVIDGEVIAVNVFGGSKGYAEWRSFLPERVSKPVVKRSRRAAV
jgi:hypothetical protein